MAKFGYRNQQFETLVLEIVFKNSIHPKYYTGYKLPEKEKIMFIKNISTTNVKFKPVNISPTQLYQLQYQVSFDSTVNSPTVQYSMLGNTILMSKHSIGYSVENSWYFLINRINGSVFRSVVNTEDVRILANLESGAESAFYLAGVNKTVSSTNNMLITKIDAVGNELWKTAYKIDDTKNSRITIMDLDSNGDIICGGAAQDSDPNMNMMVCKIDKNNGDLLAIRLIKAPTTYRISSIKVDKTNNYVYFIAQEYTGTTAVANVIMGCLDNNLNTVWVKSTNATTETVRGSNTFSLIGSEISIAFVGSNVVFVYRTSDASIIGVAEQRILFLELNKATGNIITQRMSPDFTRFGFIKIENSDINYFGIVQFSGPVLKPFVTRISNWNTGSFTGYSYDRAGMFGASVTTLGSIVDKYDNYLMGYESLQYPYIIKTQEDYTNNFSTAYTGTLATITTMILSDLSVSNTDTLSSYTSVTPTYSWAITSMV